MAGITNAEGQRDREAVSRIPLNVWQEVAALLLAGLTGQIVLNVNSGRVESATLSRHIRAVSRTPPTKGEEGREH